MKFFLLSLILLCLIGCGKEEKRQTRRRVVYPALTESPPPLLPSNPNFSKALDEKPQRSPVPHVEESWMEKLIQKEELIKSLREQTAKNPNDPFALTEEAIEELSKADDIQIL